jgi:hypothetical protein
MEEMQRSNSDLKVHSLHRECPGKRVLIAGHGPVMSVLKVRVEIVRIECLPLG